MNGNSTLPNEIEKLIGKTFVIQLNLNDYNWNYIQLKRCLTTFERFNGTAMKLMTTVSCQLLTTYAYLQIPYILCFKPHIVL